MLKVAWGHWHKIQGEGSFPCIWCSLLRHSFNRFVWHHLTTFHFTFQLSFEWQSMFALISGKPLCTANIFSVTPCKLLAFATTSMTSGVCLLCPAKLSALFFSRSFYFDTLQKDKVWFLHEVLISTSDKSLPTVGSTSLPAVEDWTRRRSPNAVRRSYRTPVFEKQLKSAEWSVEGSERPTFPPNRSPDVCSKYAFVVLGIFLYILLWAVFLMLHFYCAVLTIIVLTEEN